MATKIRFDSGAGSERVTLTEDDVAVTMTIATFDDVGGAHGTEPFTTLTAQQAVDLARGDKAGQITMDVDNGLLWSIASDNSSVFTVQKDPGTPQQIPLTAAQTGVIVAWLVASLPDVHAGPGRTP